MTNKNAQPKLLVVESRKLAFKRTLRRFTEILTRIARIGICTYYVAGKSLFYINVFKLGNIVQSILKSNHGWLKKKTNQKRSIIE